MNSAVANYFQRKVQAGSELATSVADIRQRHLQTFALAAVLLLFMAIGSNLVFSSDAYGMLYAPVILCYFLFTHSTKYTWYLAAVAMLLSVSSALLTLLGSDNSVSPGTLLYHHGLGLSTLAVTAELCRQIGNLVSEVCKDHEQLAELNAKLLSKDNLLSNACAVNKFGGYSIKMPEKVVSVSDEVLSIFGLPLDTAPDLARILEFYNPAARYRVKDGFWAVLNEGESFDYEARINTRQGEERWLRIMAWPWLNSAGDTIGVQGSIQDITSTRLLESTVQEQCQQFQKMANSLPVIVWTADASGKATFINQAACDYSELELEPDSMLNKISLLIHPRDRVRLTNSWAKITASQTYFEDRVRLLNKFGEYEWHSIQAKPAAYREGIVSEWCGIATNIHHLRKTRQKYRQAAELLNNTFESFTDILFTIDQNWKLTNLNSKAADVFEGTIEQLIGKDAWVKVSKLMEEDCAERLRNASMSQSVTDFTHFSKHLGIWIKCHAYPMSRGMVVYIQDVHIQQLMRQQLQESQHLESLGYLTSGIAHEFNNLLTVILGNAQILSGELSDKKEVAMQLEMIEKASLGGAQLVSKLLAFSRNQSLQNELQDINNLISRFKELLLHEVLGDTEVILELTDDATSAMVDSLQLESALLNFLLNAKQAMPNGGKITVATSNIHVSHSARDRHTGLNPGDYVRISISDEGIGISEENLSRIFDPFFSTKELGSGLGLSSVFGFAKQSRGHVSVDSKTGEGSTFHLYLPAMLEQKAGAETGFVGKTNFADWRAAQMSIHRQESNNGLNAPLLRGHEVAKSNQHAQE